MRMSKPEKKPLVPALRFPEFQNAGEWEKKKLGEFLEESRVLGNKGDIARKITVKLWGKGVYEKNETIEGSINTQYYYRKAGQFIYSKLDFLNQAFGIIPDYLDGYESTVDLPCFDIKENLHPIFLLEYVKQKGFYEKQGEAADGSRKAKRIHADIFLSFPIFTPVKEEQQKIADCLSSIDDLITAQTQKLAALKAHKKGLMQQLFPAEGETVPKLRFPEFRDGGEWRVKAVSKLAKITTGNKDTQDKIDDGEFPFFVRSQTIERINSYSFDGEAVLTAGDGVGVGKIFHYLVGKFDFHQRVYCIFDFKDEIIGKYFYLYFSSHFYNRVMQLSAKNSVDSVRMAMIADMPIMVPKVEEQQKIADCLSSIDELITAQSQKIEALKCHKKGLMQQLFPSMDEVDG